MSARETHPIDDRFRQGLINAEVAPPPSVWENIQRERAPRRLLPPWFRLNSILLVLIPLMGFTTYMLWPEKSAGTKAGGARTEQRATAGAAFVSIESETDNSLIVDPPMANHADAVEVSNSTTVTANGPASIPGTSGTVDPQRGSDGKKDAPWKRSDRTTATTAGPGIIEVERTDPGMIGTNTGPNLKDTEVVRIDPLKVRPSRTTTGPAPLTAPPVRPYVLPPAEWVFSIGMMRYDLHRKWYGKDDDLVKALNDSEANTSTYAIGIGIGRHWRSGWGLSIGAFHERSEQQFRFAQDRVTVEQEVQTYIVTLNTDVYFSNSDTIVHVNTTREEFDGTNRRSVVRIPMEGHFHWSRRRLTYGPRIGLAVEFTQVEQDRSITLDRTEGRLTATTLSSAELRERHPIALYGQVGADLGYTINEKWSLWATPSYLFPATPLTRTAEAWTAPYRFGAGLRLSYHFTPKR